MTTGYIVIVVLPTGHDTQVSAFHSSTVAPDGCAHCGGVASHATIKGSRHRGSGWGGHAQPAFPRDRVPRRRPGTPALGYIGTAPDVWAIVHAYRAFGSVERMTGVSSGIQIPHPPRLFRMLEPEPTECGDVRVSGATE